MGNSLYAANGCCVVLFICYAGCSDVSCTWFHTYMKSIKELRFNTFCEQTITEKVADGCLSEGIPSTGKESHRQVAFIVLIRVLSI